MIYTIVELQALNIEELLKESHKAKQEVFRLALLIRTGSEKNTSLLRRARKYVAQLAGMIHSKQSVNSKKSV